VSTSADNPSNLRIGSHYAFPVTLNLTGSVFYSFQIVPGLNRLNVVRGTYTYSFTAYGQFKTGTITVGEAGLSLIISPLK
jgi:hypothetical protein